MKFSNEMIDVLKNFSRVNKSIILDGGECIKTISLDEVTIGVYQPKEKLNFEDQIGIYDLLNFISSIQSIGDPEKVDIDFTNDDSKIILKSGNLKLLYSKSEIELIQNNAVNSTCEKFKSFDKFNASFDLSEDEMKKIFNIGKSMNFDTLEIIQDKLSVYNSQNPLANVFDVDIKVTGEIAGIKLFLQDLIMYEGNYKISIADNTLVKFENKSLENRLFYFVAPLENE